jgi:hypothetical protein
MNNFIILIHTIITFADFPQSFPATRRYNCWVGFNRKISDVKSGNDLMSKWTGLLPGAHIYTARFPWFSPCTFPDFPNLSPMLLYDKYSRCFPIIWILPYSNTKENLPLLHFSPISSQTRGFGNLNLSHPNRQSPGRTGICTEIYRQIDWDTRFVPRF